MKYDTVIGLEVHLQLDTKTKLFCGSLAKFGAPPNSQTCPVCLGLPGALPVLNEQALNWGIRVARALNCKIAKVMKFDRKQYFYPDLPKNYQISQYDQPLAQNGYLEIYPGERVRRIAIRRVHLEEDAGKLLHDASQTESFVDFNRAGVPLLEIVSEPDLRSPEEAYAYLTGLKAIIGYLDVSNCNMEEGSLRCDSNISLRPAGNVDLGVKVEVKNLNSFRAVRQSLEFEVRRQTLALEQGGRIVQETRLWDAKAQRTESMRSKEVAADYRYFPEPDLVPFVIPKERVEKINRTLPELPCQRRARLKEVFGLSDYEAQVLTQSRCLAELFEKAVYSMGASGARSKPVANWIMGDFLAYCNSKSLDPEEVKVRPEWFAHLVQLIDEGTISGKMAKGLFVEALEKEIDPLKLVEERGLKQIVDVSELERLADALLRENAASVDDYARGKRNALMHLVGQGMKRSKGKANPQQLTAILQRKLDILRMGQEAGS